MDLQRLKERYPILVSYMENQHYSWQYIKYVKNEARWILRESENYGWKTYDDVYQTYVKKYSNKYTLLYKRDIMELGLLEFLENAGIKRIKHMQQLMN